MARACYEHRASYTGKYSNELAELMSAADRGAPDVDGLLKRSILSGINTTVAASIKHVKQKYGLGGYARFNSVYSMYYGDALDAQFAKLEHLHEDDPIVLVEKRLYEGAVEYGVLKDVVSTAIKMDMPIAVNPGDLVIEDYGLSFVDMLLIKDSIQKSIHGDPTRTTLNIGGYILTIPESLMEVLVNANAVYILQDSIVMDTDITANTLSELDVIRADNREYWEAMNDKAIRNMDFVLCRG